MSRQAFRSRISWEAATIGAVSAALVASLSMIAYAQYMDEKYSNLPPDSGERAEVRVAKPHAPENRTPNLTPASGKTRAGDARAATRRVLAA